MGEKYPVNSVKISFDIAEEIVSQDGGGVSELAEKLDIPKSTVHDHLSTLKRRGFVVQEDNEYHVSYRFLELGERRRHNEELVKTASPELEALAEETDEYVNLVVEENGEAIIIDTKKGNRAVRVTVYNGIRMKMHTVAAGKAILAHLPSHRIEEILDTHGLVAHTENTTTNREELYEELREIRQQGYALDDEERISGVRSVASPLIDRTESILGSITVYGPTQRIDEKRFTETLPQKLLETSNVIEVTMNYE